MEYLEATFEEFLSNYMHRLSYDDCKMAAFIGGERNVYLMASRGHGVFDGTEFVKKDHLMTKLEQKEEVLREIMLRYGFKQAGGKKW